MYVFLGEFDFPDFLWLRNQWSLEVGDFYFYVSGKRFSCLINGQPSDDFQTVKNYADTATDCVSLGMSFCLHKPIYGYLNSWLKLDYDQTADRGKYQIGHSINVPDGYNALPGFELIKEGLKYSNQAFQEITLRIALQDFRRTFNAPWDEQFYHLQHCIEAVRDYFGRGSKGWANMRDTLDVSEPNLREITDFTSRYIRHGASRAQIANLKIRAANFVHSSNQTCTSLIEKFAGYLDETGVVNYSVVKEFSRARMRRPW